MAYTDLDATATDANSPITQSLMDLIRTNFTDLDSRSGDIAGYFVLTSTTDFATTAPSTSTITMNTDQTTDISEGMALRMTHNSVTTYAIVKSITSSLITIYGPPLATGASQFTALAFGKAEKVKILDAFMSSFYAASKRGDIYRINENRRLIYRGPPAKLVHADNAHAIGRIGVSTAGGVLDIVFGASWTTGTFDMDIVDISMNQVSFNTSNAQTLTDIAAEIQSGSTVGSDFIKTAVSDGTDTVTVTFEFDIWDDLTNLVTAGGGPSVTLTPTTTRSGPKINITIGRPPKMDATGKLEATGKDVFTTGVKVLGNYISEAATITSDHGTTNLTNLVAFDPSLADWVSDARVWVSNDIIFSIDLGASKRIKYIVIKSTSQPTDQGSGTFVQASNSASPGSTDWSHLFQPVNSASAQENYVPLLMTARHIRIMHTSSANTASNTYEYEKVLVYEEDGSLSEINVDPDNYSVVDGDQIFHNVVELATVDGTELAEDWNSSLVFVLE